MLAYPILGTKLNFRETISLVPVILGAIMVCIGEVKLTFFGLILTLLGCVASSMKSILTKVFLSGDSKLHSMQLLRHLALLGCKSYILREP